MRKTELETWVLSIIERAQKGQPVEDSRVEMKAEWVEAAKAARRIAGHANAARGMPILWLVGVGERGEVRGADYNELSRWYSEVKSKFDDLAPELSMGLNVLVEDKTISALLFETDRAPYVVKNPDDGRVTLEVPWREATGTRSAKRADLLRILSRHQQEPALEVVKCRFEFPTLVFDVDPESPGGLSLDVYVIPRGDEPVVIPFHRCEGFLKDVGTSCTYGFTTLFFSRSFYNVCSGMEPSSGFHNLAISQHDIILRGPGMACIRAFTDQSIRDAEEAEVLHLNLSLGTADPNVSIKLEQTLLRRHDAHSPNAYWDSKEIAKMDEPAGD